MMSQIQLSGDAIGGIIWLFIFVIWGVGKVITSLREQKIRREYDQRIGDPAQEGPKMEDQLRNFLETLTGEELPPWSTPQPPPQPQQRQAQMPPPQPPQAVAAPAPVAPAPTRVSPYAKRRRGQRQSVHPSRSFNPLLADAGMVAGQENEVSKAHAGAALPGHEYMLGTRNDGMRLPAFGLKLPDPNKKASAIYRYVIGSPDDLRRAMIDRVVLGPPRGMSPSMPCEDQRQV